jgi:hypothetical protein
MARFTAQYHVACQIQRKILGKMGLEFQQANRTPKPTDADCDLSPKDLSLLAASWNTMEERKRILRMKPLPKSQDVTPKPVKAKPLAPTE